MARTRPPALAGSWYPSAGDILGAQVDTYLEGAEPRMRSSGRPLVAIVPHAGYRYSGAVAGKLYGLLKDLPIDRIFILAPNHRAAIRKVALSGAGSFMTPLGRVELDVETIDALGSGTAFEIDDEAHRQEHAVEIQLPLIQRTWPDRVPRLIPMLVPRLADEERRTAADALKTHLDDRSLLVVSTDFTHYGPAFGFEPFDHDVPGRIEELDTGATGRILAADPEGLLRYGAETGITMCGLEAAALALSCGLPDRYEGKLLDYSRSADADGDFSHSVSYAAILLSSGTGSDAT